MIEGKFSEFQAFHSTGKNKCFLYMDNKNIFIGSEGDGPAISFGTNISTGTTQACETFDSPILVAGGEKYVDDQFTTKNIEIFIL